MAANAMKVAFALGVREMVNLLLPQVLREQGIEGEIEIQDVTALITRTRIKNGTSIRYFDIQVKESM